jgi:hypothetical protein
MTGQKIEVTGLREFQRSLKLMDAGLPKKIRVVLNDAAKLVTDEAGARMPTKTGRARASLKARSTQRDARVGLGGKRAPYAPWLDFGGEGRRKGRPAARPFLKNGRYVYVALDHNRAKITAAMQDGLAELARDSGLEVT